MHLRCFWHASDFAQSALLAAMHSPSRAVHRPSSRQNLDLAQSALDVATQLSSSSAEQAPLSRQSVDLAQPALPRNTHASAAGADRRVGKGIRAGAPHCDTPGWWDVDSVLPQCA